MISTISSRVDLIIFSNNNNNFCGRENHSCNVLNPLSTNPTKWSNTLKQFVGNIRRIV